MSTAGLAARDDLWPLCTLTHSPLLCLLSDPGWSNAEKNRQFHFIF